MNPTRLPGPDFRDWPASLPPVLAGGADWIALDKPAGLAVHPGPRTPDSLETRLLACGSRARPAHRLDRDTSGVLLLGRNRAGLRRLSAAFAAGAIAKAYLALLAGAGDLGADGLVSAPLAKRSGRGTGWRMVVARDGAPAETRWRLLAQRGGLALVMMQPLTGRTHQLRVHAGVLAPGAAIRGDPVYGRADPAGLMLHAWSLELPGRDGERVTVRSPLPARFVTLGFGPGDLPA